MITVSININASIQKVWTYFTEPSHIMQWYFASPDWHAPFAQNDLVINGKFKTTMAAKDGSFSFDFSGVYTNVVLHQTIQITLDDTRKLNITFLVNDNVVTVTEEFEPETENSVELQQAGWQAILNNFKNYTENN